MDEDGQGSKLTAQVFVGPVLFEAEEHYCDKACWGWRISTVLCNELSGLGFTIARGKPNWLYSLLASTTFVCKSRLRDGFALFDSVLSRYHISIKIVATTSLTRRTMFDVLPLKAMMLGRGST